MNWKCSLSILALVVAGIARPTSDLIYDEQADARREIKAAIAEASRKGQPARNVLLVFGANWCPDCHALDQNMQKPELASIIEKNFVVVKVDVGRMNKNVDLAEQYGVPVKNGIPALAVLDPRGKPLYAQDQGQFANARHMSYETIKAFFEQWKPRHN